MLYEVITMLRGPACPDLRRCIDNAFRAIDNFHQTSYIWRLYKHRIAYKPAGQFQFPCDGHTMIGLSTYAFFWQISDRAPKPLSLHVV